MNWPLFCSTFVLIFLAELGDKTQLAVMSQSASHSAKWTVFFAGVIALAASTAIGVLAGDVLRRLVPDERVIKGAGGILFLIFGCLMLRAAFAREPALVKATPSQDAAEVTDWLGRFVIQQAAIFEKAASEDYQALAARAADPRERALFEWLAAEELQHYAQMTGVIKADHQADIMITSEMAGALPPLDNLMHDAVRASKEVEHAIEHEKSMAEFYRTLAHKSVVPKLCATFLTLALAEETHAQRLMAMRT